MDFIENEFTFKGTPDQFYEFVHVFTTKRLLKFNDPFLWNCDYQHSFYQLRDESKKIMTGVWIKAQSLPDNQTLFTLHYKKRGWKVLSQYWDLLKEEMVRLNRLVLPKKSRAGKPKNKIFVPTRKDALERYQAAYQICMKTRENYKGDWDSGATDNPIPVNADFIDAITNEMDWKPGSKTLYRILIAGDNGLLK